MPSISAETTYKITVFARNEPTFETLKVRFNAESKEWECSWEVTRIQKMPHRNSKTGLAEGMVMKHLEDVGWHTYSNTPLNPKKTTLIP
jgi:hypothetical protein